MNDMLAKLIEFAFILAVPLVLVGGGLVTLFAVGAFFEVAEEPAELKRRIEGAFRRPPRPARPIGPDHYYHPYWEDSGGRRAS